MWKLCDDRDGSEIFTGDEEQVKHRWFLALQPDQGGYWEGNLYIEKPSGDHIAWNPHTKRWDAL